MSTLNLQPELLPSKKQRGTLRPPFTRATDPIADARHALAAGVDPERIVTMLLPSVLRHRRVGALHRLLSAHGGAEVLERALDAYQATEAA